jgi:hypothetical protein
LFEQNGHGGAVGQFTLFAVDGEFHS